MSFRAEKDTLGVVNVPKDKYWGAQTERSRNNFKIGNPGSMPIELIYGFAYLKKQLPMPMLNLVNWKRTSETSLPKFVMKYWKGCMTINFHL